MAIDDNTVYGLYGSQIKDLAGKIEEKQDELTAGEGISITDESGALVISSTGGSGPTVVQTTGTSTTDVMSQNAVTSMVYADPSTTQKVNIGGSIDSGAAYGTVLGYQATITSSASNRAVAIGYRAGAQAAGSVALGTGAGPTRVGEVNIGSLGSTAYGFNNSNYRVLGGVYDGQTAHDAATKGQLDSAVNTIETELDAKQDILTAGQNITIAEESGALVISATGGSGADVFTTNEWNALWA